MLDTTATIVLLLGAVFITVVGAAANYATQTDGNKVNVKTVSRDFVIGLALSSVAYFFIPESFHSLGKSIQEVKLPELSGGSAGSVGDLDLHVGPARF
jgi:hypothetical protein